MRQERHQPHHLDEITAFLDLPGHDEVMRCSAVTPGEAV